MIQLVEGRLYRLRNGEVHQANPHSAASYLEFEIGHRYYPQSGWHQNPHYTVVAEVPETVVGPSTLRDWFAGQVLAGSNGAWNAYTAYEVADQMLKAREGEK